MDDDLAAARSLATPLRGPEDLDPLVERLADARLVLVGEASHGTHEYYAWRDRLSRRLVAELGFAFVAVEGDWPDCRRLHRWLVADAGRHDGVDEALAGYDRWPTWMWANADVRDAMTWLRAHNLDTEPGRRVGFHGLDVYSLRRSMDEVLGWLRANEPELVAAATQAYGCFEPFGADPFDYAKATRWVPDDCEEPVVRVLREMCQRHAGERDGGRDGRFVAEQNAAVVANAERYYRAAVRGGAESWNVRDTHMADTLDRLLAHAGPDAKGIVWAHNTHVGDARASDMAEAGMVSLGQLVRERHGEDGVALVGMAGHRGGVLAGESWGAQPRRLPVPPARAGSVEDMLHTALGDEPAVLVFPPTFEQPRWLRTALDLRAIGVVYDPDRERWGNYVPSTLGDRYDALLWFGDTTALDPLRAEPAGDPEPETAPTGQ